MVGRIRRALEHARRVVSVESDAVDILDVLADKRHRSDQQVDEDDDEEAEAEAEYEQRGKYVGYPETWYVPWNKMKAKGFKKSDWDMLREQATLVRAAAAAGAEPEYSSSNSQNVPFDEAKYGRMLEVTFEDWTPPGDSLDKVFRSSLLNTAQLSSMYSTVGVRVHLRQALLTCGVRAGAGNALRRDGQDFVRMRKEVGRTIYFAAAEVIRQDTFRRELVDGGLTRFAEARCVRFCLADYDSDIASYAIDLDVTDLLREAFSDMLEEPHACELLAVELPALNPFCLFSKDPKKKRFYFQQTQADFVARIVPDGRANGPIVVGEYKSLMEVRKGGKPP